MQERMELSNEMENKVAIKNQIEFRKNTFANLLGKHYFVLISSYM